MFELFVRQLPHRPPNIQPYRHNGMQYDYDNDTAGIVTQLYLNTSYVVIYT